MHREDIYLSQSRTRGLTRPLAFFFVSLKLATLRDIKRRMIYVASLIFRGLDRSCVYLRANGRAPVIGCPVSLSIRYIIKSCPVTGGGRNAISEWTTITSRVIEPGQCEPMCKSNIGCCDTYARTLYYAVYRDSLRSAVRELS